MDDWLGTLEFLEKCLDVSRKQLGTTTDQSRLFLNRFVSTKAQNMLALRFSGFRLGQVWTEYTPLVHRELSYCEF